MSDDFFRTGMGRKFYEGTMPALVRELGDVVDRLDRILRVLEKVADNLSKEKKE